MIDYQEIWKTTAGQNISLIILSLLPIMANMSILSMAVKHCHLSFATPEAIVLVEMEAVSLAAALTWIPGL